MSAPDVFASKPTIVELSYVLEPEGDTKPPSTGKYFIKPGYWKAVLAQITKLEQDHAGMTVVLSDFCNHRLLVQQDFNLLEMKQNDLKTDDKSSRSERLELLTKINDVATNSHPDAIWYLIKESIEPKIKNQDPIIDSTTVNIKLLEAEIYAIKSSFKTLDMKVDAILHE